MRRFLLPIFLTTLGVMLTTQVADACGDKFLLVGRGIKYQRGYAATYRANILLYVAPSAGGQSVMQDAKFHEALRSAGHVITVVQSTDTARSALKAGTYDIVLTELSPVLAGTLGTESELLASTSSLLPVGSKEPTKAQIETCKRLFATCKLKDSGKAVSFLEVIDKEMEARAKAQKTKK